MDKEFEDFIARRCSNMLEKDVEYKTAENEQKCEEEIIDIVERKCYMKGWSDAFKIIKCSTNM